MESEDVWVKTAEGGFYGLCGAVPKADPDDLGRVAILRTTVAEV